MPELLPPDNLLTTAQIAKMLNIGAKQVTRLCKDGTLPAKKFGTCWIATTQAVTWYQANRVETRGNPNFGKK